MNSRNVDYRALLARLLRLEELPRLDRMPLQQALRSGVGERIEQAGLLTLDRIAEPGPADGSGPRGEANGAGFDAGPVGGAGLRVEENGPGYEADRDPAPATIEPTRSGAGDAIRVVSRSSLPAHARAGLDQVRRLLRLDDPLLSSDPRRPDARVGLIAQLSEAGREVLGASELRFIPSSGDAGLGGAAHLSAALATEALAHPGAIYYCPDASRCAALDQGLRGRVASLVMARVSSAAGEALGVLEVSSARRDPFSPDDLAMVALLADYCAGVLERAERIEKLIFIDPLTSAYNRSYFDLQLQNEMARAQREQGSVALCIADIDDFKSFNTIYGYEAGNQVLIQVAQALRGGVRPFDTVARWGGEEFAVLLTAPVQAQDVATISERLRSLVERQPVPIEALDRRSHRVAVTVSIGVALFPDHETTAADLWRGANRALLEAKRPPKNQVVFYRPPGDSRPSGS